MEEEKIIAEETAEEVVEKKPKRKTVAKRPRKKAQLVDEFLQKKAVAEKNIPEKDDLISEDFLAEDEQIERIEGDKIEENDSQIGDKSERQRKIIRISAIILIGVMVLGLVGTAGYFCYKYKKLSKGNVKQDEVANYTKKIGKFMALPEGKPALATVTDKEKLASQTFFANAQNGDKVLIYAKDNVVILYRPSENKIIKVVSLSGGDINPVAPASPVAENKAPEQTQTSAEAQPEAVIENVTVAVYNGTNTKGLAASGAEKAMKIEGLKMEIVEKTNAKGSYPATQVINLSGKDEAAKKIAEIFGAEVKSELPKWEAKPQADILIIVGSDFKN